MAIKITGNHSGPLNMRAAFVLNGVWKGDASALIDLMRSNETIDPQTREAIAEAFERKSGLRLELHKGNEAPLAARLPTELRYQEIADAFQEQLAEPGAVEKNVKADVAKQFGVSVRTVGTALLHRKGAAYRLSRGEV